VTGPVGKLLTLRGVSTLGDEGPSRLLRRCQLQQIRVHIVVYVLRSLLAVVGKDRLLLVPTHGVGDGTRERTRTRRVVVGNSHLHFKLLTDVLKTF
jgi:hypothetical protein